MNEPIRRYPLMIVPQPAPSEIASARESARDGLDAGDGADPAARVPYLHLVTGDDADQPDAQGAEEGRP